MELEHIVVVGMNEAALTFIRLLIYKELSFVVLTNNRQEEKQLLNIGVPNVIRINTNDRSTWSIPTMVIGEVFIFESSLALSCRYVQCCRLWTFKPIYVITPFLSPRAIYKGLGANHVIYSQTGEISFLLNVLDAGL
ncbi:MAG: hypothetical protein ACE3L7_29930 [Candidatus Pristimantibacillus sp.]